MSIVHLPVPLHAPAVRIGLIEIGAEIEPAVNVEGSVMIGKIGEGQSAGIEGQARSGPIRRLFGKCYC